jgi:starch phosphorylase
MSLLTPQISANRAVREYTDKHYIARAKAHGERSKDHGAAGALIQWRKAVEEHWPRLRFGSLDVASEGGRHTFIAQVFLDDLDAEAVRVELFADATDHDRMQIVEMKRGEPLVGASTAHHYVASVASNRAAGDFTPRVVPRHPLASVPLECARILWYR